MAFVKLCDCHHAITAADLLNDRVLPFFEAYAVPLLLVLTDRGSEYCDNRETYNTSMQTFIESAKLA